MLLQLEWAVNSQQTIEAVAADALLRLAAQIGDEAKISVDSIILIRLVRVLVELLNPKLDASLIASGILAKLLSLLRRFPQHNVLHTGIVGLFEAVFQRFKKYQ